MSTTSEVAHAPQARLAVLVSDEDFEDFGVDIESLSDEDCGIAIGNQSSHSYVIFGTPDQLMQLAGQITTVARSIKSKEFSS